VIEIRRATPDDAKLLTDLSYTTFWDAFAHHPKNAPDDLNHYMRQAFNIEQITAELAEPAAIFLIAELDGKPAGYAKLIVDSTEHGVSATRPIELSRLYSHQEFLGKGVGQNLMDACFELGILPKEWLSRGRQTHIPTRLRPADRPTDAKGSFTTESQRTRS
jgi:GNAT superfamily N-acetyltransferase